MTAPDAGKEQAAVTEQDRKAAHAWLKAREIVGPYHSDPWDAPWVIALAAEFARIRAEQHEVTLDAAYAKVVEFADAKPLSVTAMIQALAKMLRALTLADTEPK